MRGERHTDKELVLDLVGARVCGELGPEREEQRGAVSVGARREALPEERVPVGQEGLSCANRVSNERSTALVEQVGLASLRLVVRVRSEEGVPAGGLVPADLHTHLLCSATTQTAHSCTRPQH